jgi:hypothetical protein
VFAGADELCAPGDPIGVIGLSGFVSLEFWLAGVCTGVCEDASSRARRVVESDIASTNMSPFLMTISLLKFNGEKRKPTGWLAWAAHIRELASLN